MYTTADITNKIFLGDSKTILKQFPTDSVDLVVTSPPYFSLRNYQHKDQIGLEGTPQEYIKNLIDVFRECKRVLKRTGSIWVNISDTFAGGGGDGNNSSFIRNGNNEERKAIIPMPDKAPKSKLRYTMGKSLLGIPERFVIAMQDELGLIRRNTIIWHKPSCMPSSAKDRFTIDFEYFYFFTKEPKYFFNTQYEPMKTFEDKEYISKEYKGKGKKAYKENGVQDPADIKKRILASWNQKIKFGGLKYPNNQDSVTNRTYSGNEWQPSELGRIKRAVWSLNTGNSFEHHFASYPEALIETPIKACTDNNHSLVLDPFLGSGTTAIKAQKMGRSYCGIDINEDYVKIVNKRFGNMLEAFI